MIDVTPVSVGSSNPTPGPDFTDSETTGTFVVGSVSGSGAICAGIGLYRMDEPAGVPVGVTDSDSKGQFEFYNIQPGQYKVKALVYETGAWFTTEPFTVTGTTITLDALNLVNDGFGSDTDQDKDVDGGNLTAFVSSFNPGVPADDDPMDLNADGFVDDEDLELFALNFGRVSF